MPVARQLRAFGAPFAGYNSAQLRHAVSPDEITGDSLNFEFDSQEGKFQSRLGSAIVFDAGGAGAPVGLLEKKIAGRCRQILPIRSPSIADGYPVVGSLWTNETTHAAQLYFRSTNDNTGQVIGKSFAAQYPTLDATNPWDLKCVPYWSQHAQRMGRLATKSQRTFALSGTRRAVGVGDYLLFGSLTGGCAQKWNRCFNDSTTTSDSNNERLRPLGHIPPLAVPKIQVPAKTGGGIVAPWTGKNRFYISVMFKNKDGSFTRPFIPRGPKSVAVSAANGSDVAQNYAGYIENLTKSGDADTDKYEYIDWIEIPTGGPDCIERWLLRGTIADGSAATNGVADPNSLKVTAIIPNNTQTTYRDTAGSDLALGVDTSMIRYDHIWPYCARYATTFDQRVILGYIRRHNAAVLLTQRVVKNGSGLARPTEDAAATGSVIATASVRHDQTQNPRLKLVVWREEGTGEATVPATSGYTLQDLVDTLGAQRPASAAGDWKGQIVPGADDLATLDNLELTQFKINCATAGTATLTANNQTDGVAGDFSQVLVGMKIKGTKMPNATGYYVGAVTDATHIAMVDADGNSLAAVAGALSEDIWIGFDFGDGTPGGMRDFGFGCPAILFFNNAYRAAQDTLKRDVLFSGGGPTHAGGRIAMDNFYAGVHGGFRSSEEQAGILTGLGTLLSGAIVLYSNAVGVIRNVKGGKSGEDDDYRLELQSKGDGCIAPASVVETHGLVGYLKREGYAFNDGEREVIISGKVYDGGYGTGDSSYEVGECIKACEADTDGAFFSALVSQAVLYLTFRKDQNSTYPDRMVAYRFAGGKDRLGIRQVYAGETQDGQIIPFGWSSPFDLRISVMGEVVSSTGIHLYGAYEAGDGANTTGTGRMDEFNKAGTHDDNGAAYNLYLNFATDRADAPEKKSSRYGWLKYAKPSAGTATIRMYRDQNRSGSDTLTVPSTGGDAYGRREIRVPQEAQSPRDAIEWRYESSSGTGRHLIWGLELYIDTHLI
jgi:hypothetical protein